MSFDNFVIPITISYYRHFVYHIHLVLNSLTWFVTYWKFSFRHYVQVSYTRRYLLVGNGQKLPYNGTLEVGEPSSDVSVGQCSGLCTRLRQQCGGFVFNTSSSSSSDSSSEDRQLSGTCQPVTYDDIRSVHLQDTVSSWKLIPFNFAFCFFIFYFLLFNVFKNFIIFSF